MGTKSQLALIWKMNSLISCFACLYNFFFWWYVCFNLPVVNNSLAKEWVTPQISWFRNNQINIVSCELYTNEIITVITMLLITEEAGAYLTYGASWLIFFYPCRLTEFLHVAFDLLLVKVPLRDHLECHYFKIWC